MAKEAKKQDPQQQLEALFNKLVKQHSEFTQPLVELPEHEFAKAGLIQGLVEGNLTPPVMLIALTEGHWEYAADTAKFDDLAYQLLSDIEGDWPVYAVVDDGLNHRILALFGADGSDGTVHGIEQYPCFVIIVIRFGCHKCATVVQGVQIPDTTAVVFAQTVHPAEDTGLQGHPLWNEAKVLWPEADALFIRDGSGNQLRLVIP
ncbi:hypothetical protein BvCmsHHNP015_02885 [Escherichia coli]|nr:hypothetical protein C4A71_01035 [Escherichia coli]RDO75453.1 hypothetical protein C4A69_00988 [Escherichia coli]GCS06448.1 hypothetical protein BvCmsHHNP015_02885 [Escherichia coli]GDM04447.1 hypothetical protein BvCmsKSNP112_00488 [Escherichia coli]